MAEHGSRLGPHGHHRSVKDLLADPEAFYITQAAQYRHEDPRTKRLSNLSQLWESESESSLSPSLSSSTVSTASSANAVPRSNSPLYTLSTDHSSASANRSPALATEPSAATKSAKMVSKKKTSFDTRIATVSDSSGPIHRRPGDSLPLRQRSLVEHGPTPTGWGNPGLRLQAELRRARSQTSMDDKAAEGSIGPHRGKASVKKRVRNSWHPDSVQDKAQLKASTAETAAPYPTQLPPPTPSRETKRPNIYESTHSTLELILETIWGIRLEDLQDPVNLWLPTRQLLQELSQVIDVAAILPGCHSFDQTRGPITHYGSGGNGSQSTGSASGQTVASGKETAKRKNDQDHRGKNQERDDDDDDLNDSEADEDEKARQDRGKSKMRRLDSCTKFSCPFRKRNPNRFNIRDHESCAKSPFSTFSNLKKHILVFHGRQNACERCGESFPSTSDLQDHKMLPKNQMCESNQNHRSDLRAEVESGTRDPEDGISISADGELRERRRKYQIMDWKSLWMVLFPGDADVIIPLPDFVEPVVAELHEVYAFIRNSMHNLTQVLLAETERSVQQALLAPNFEANPSRQLRLFSESILLRTAQLQKRHYKEFEAKIGENPSVSLEAARNLGRHTQVPSAPTVTGVTYPELTPCGSPDQSISQRSLPSALNIAPAPVHHNVDQGLPRQESIRLPSANTPSQAQPGNYLAYTRAGASYAEVTRSDHPPGRQYMPRWSPPAPAVAADRPLAHSSMTSQPSSSTASGSFSRSPGRNSIADHRRVHAGAWLTQPAPTSRRQSSGVAPRRPETVGYNQRDDSLNNVGRQSSSRHGSEGHSGGASNFF